jgi:hypothetical protein
MSEQVLNGVIKEYKFIVIIKEKGKLVTMWITCLGDYK